MEITKEGAQSLRMKMPTAELYLKEATIIYGFYLLTAKIAQTKVKVVKARLLALVQLQTQEQAFNWAMNTELLKFKSLRWLKPPLLSKRALLHCM